ncbi:MAG: hypothetical protein WCF84_24450 [Anaerolineae bacterium]
MTARIDGWQRMDRRVVLPVLTGLVGALALVGVYLGILSLLQSFDHALGQLSQDWLWVGLVAIGFGAQLGLYAYLRLIIRTTKLAGASALTGAGTGTSTLGMVACCAHHITDIVPLIGLTSASGLSGVVAFFGDYKSEIIWLGLLVNLVGITLSLRTIRRQREHLRLMTLHAQADSEHVVVSAYHQV